MKPETTIAKIQRVVAGIIPGTTINVALAKREHTKAMRAAGMSRKEAEHATWEKFRNHG